MSQTIHGRRYEITARGPVLEPCAPHDVLSRLGDKWTTLVMSLLAIAPDNRLRFSQIKNGISGISQRMLTLTLRYLERDGLLVRHYFAEVPPRVEYELSRWARACCRRSKALPTGSGRTGRRSRIPGVNSTPGMHDARQAGKTSSNRTGAPPGAFFFERNSDGGAEGQGPAAEDRQWRRLRNGGRLAQQKAVVQCRDGGYHRCRERRALARASGRRRRAACLAVRLRPVQGPGVGRADPHRLLRRAILSWQIVIPDFGTVSGAFQVTALEYGGAHNGEVTFDIALESAGAIAFGAL
ncbi:MAG: phage tail tube protein [Pantoea sp.]|nr:phage tail tube protein [Pantoea sp.]MDE1186267.1 phage tail tube protein [Pantoea sp.]